MLAVGAALLCLGRPAAADGPAAAVFHVRADAAPGGDGLAWASAGNDLQQAIEAAAAAAVQLGEPAAVWVAAGTYKPTSWPNGGTAEREKHFALRHGVAVLGGFPATGEPGLDDREPARHATILSGDLGVAGDFADNCYHVFYHANGTFLDATAILDGVTVTGGHANGSGTYFSNGGGMYNYGASPTLARCRFVDNRAYGGGAIGNVEASPLISETTFADNQAASSGGAMRNQRSQPVISACAFVGNLAQSSGGAMLNFRSSPILLNCTFAGNQAGSGAAVMNGYGSSPQLSFCTFFDHRASLVFLNHPPSGPWLLPEDECKPVLVNCILWNPASMYEIMGGTPTVVDSLVRRGFPGGVNIIDADPLLQPAHDNGGPTPTCALSPGSPALDAGIAGPDTPLVDQRGQPRDGQPDLGAFEGVATTPWLAVQPPVVDFGQVAANRRGRIKSFTVAAANRQTGVEVAVPEGFLMRFPNGQWEHTRLAVPLGPHGTIQRLVEVKFLPVDCRSHAATVEIDGEVLLLTGTGVAGGVIHVDQGVAAGGDGRSWHTAFADLQAGIDAALPYLDEVWVAAGTYRPTSFPNGGSDEREMHFSLRNGVQMYGGFAGGETARQQRDPGRLKTICSGDLGQTGEAADNCRHVFYHPNGVGLDETALIDGFTIADGYAEGSYSGAGLFCLNSSPTVNACVFRNNVAEDSGGGIYLSNSRYGVPHATNLATISNCTFVGNSATKGGGIYLSGQGALINLTLVDNSATSLGGAVHLGSGPSLLLGCTLAGNQAPEGGGLYCRSGTAVVHNSILWNNGTEIGALSGTLLVSNSLVQGCHPEGTAIVDADPLLGPLASQGGPVPTLALAADSPARGLADLELAATGIDPAHLQVAALLGGTDSRGVPREPAAADAGAYEFAWRTIVATAGPNGAIDPLGEILVPHGAGRHFAILPDPHYQVAEVFVDGVSVGAVDNYAFACVTTGQAIHATFAAAPFRVVFELGPQGTRIGGGELVQAVYAGEAAVAPEIAVAAGWHFSSWEAEFAAVLGDLTVQARYAAYHPLAIAGGEGPTSAYAGQTLPIAAKVPLAGRRFSRWLGDVETLDDVNSATPMLTMPDGEVALSAIYAFELPLAAGWNAVSLPFQPLDGSLAAALRPTTRLPTLLFDAWIWQAGRFQPTLDLAPCQGAWIRVAGAAMLVFEGREVEAPEMLPTPGWNFLGPAVPMEWAGRVPGPSGWGGQGDGRYYATNLLLPGQAYWLWRD